jgi:hypothetical protein
VRTRDLLRKGPVREAIEELADLAKERHKAEAALARAVGSAKEVAKPTPI